MIFLPLLIAAYSLILAIYVWTTRPDGVSIAFLSNSILITLIGVFLPIFIKKGDPRLRWGLLIINFLLLLFLCLSWIGLFGFQEP
ncbi:hypothetical protein AWH49_18200 [Domibacillus aminovorans]|uniref:Histidine kinase n=1 Tax=Domibacillus aminovorans TaxID=29332 RepID=A0A177L346_9BACI|nr:hypothetical protein AWH49_18200 [Domibacillus aminovorans]